MRRHNLVILFLFTLILVGTIFNTYADQVADDFQPPMSGYEPGSFGGRVLGAPSALGDHLGEDHLASHLDPVYPIGSGEVVFVCERPGYGPVLVLEHTLLDGTKYCSVYGHLCKHTGTEIQVNPCEVVNSLNQPIAYIGHDSENGDGTEHLHLGLRRGSAVEGDDHRKCACDKDGDGNSNNDYKWIYYGYEGYGENYDYSDWQYRKPGHGKFTAASAFINGIVLSDGVNVTGSGTITNQTPMEVSFEIQNLTSHSIYIQDLTVAIHGTEDGYGRWIDELKHTGSITLDPYGQAGANYVYNHHPDDPDYEVVTIPEGSYYVRAKYLLDNEWVDIPIHFRNPPNMDETTENSVPLTVVKGSTTFSDVESGHWAEEFIAGMKERGIMLGNNGRFLPDEPLTRGEICTMICRAKNLQWDPSYTNPFTDLDSSHGHYEKILICYHMGYVSGDGNHFFPNYPVTRAQTCKIIYNAFDLGPNPGTNCQSSFPDMRNYPDAGLKCYVEAMRDYAVISGYEDGEFKPDRNLTRAEAAKIFSNAMSLK